jgi:hypothetical protein
MVQIFRDLLYLLDMLTLSTEAGQDFTSAMKTVIDKGTPGPLLNEFRIVHQEVTLGKTRTEALRAMAARIDLPEMTSFVLALIQAEELGTSIGKVLRIMADQMRVKRSTLAEEMAGKVPVKLMMPLILLIVPAAFIVLLFGPVYMCMTGQQLAGNENRSRGRSGLPLHRRARCEPGSRVSAEGGVRSVRIRRAVENDIVVSDAAVSRRARVDRVPTAGSWRTLGRAPASRDGFASVRRRNRSTAATSSTRRHDPQVRVVARKVLKKAAAEAKPAAPPPGRTPASVRLAPRAVPPSRAAIRPLLWPSKPGLPPQSNQPRPSLSGHHWMAHRIDESPRWGDLRRPHRRRHSPSISGGRNRGSNPFGKQVIDNSALRAWQALLVVCRARSRATDSRCRSRTSATILAGDIDPEQALWAVSKMCSTRVIVRLPRAQLAEELVAPAVSPRGSPTTSGFARPSCSLSAVRSWWR